MSQRCTPVGPALVPFRFRHVAERGKAKPTMTRTTRKEFSVGDPLVKKKADTEHYLRRYDPPPYTHKSSPVQSSRQLLTTIKYQIEDTETYQTNPHHYDCSQEATANNTMLDNQDLVGRSLGLGIVVLDNMLCHTDCPSSSFCSIPIDSCKGIHHGTRNRNQTNEERNNQ